MKRMLSFSTLILSLIVYTNVYGQAKVKENKKDSTYYEVECSFPGGDSYWGKYLQKNLDTDIPIKNAAPPGSYKITVKFFVSKNGLVDSVENQTHFGYGMEAELTRVLKSSPKWIPAEKNGQTATCYRTQSIEFVVP